MMLHEAMDDFWALLQTRGVALSVDDHLPQALVCGDRALLLRAVCNLLDNAVKYTPAGGRVRCRCGPTGPLAAQRQGHRHGHRAGGSAAALPTLLRAWAPRPAATANGAGLGLAFVHTVAWRHGGSVSVTSEPGVGSTFMLQLPVFSEDDPAFETEIEPKEQRVA